MAVASAGPYESLHLAPDRQPHQYPTTLFCTGRMPFLPPNQQRQSTEGTGCAFNAHLMCADLKEGQGTMVPSGTPLSPSVRWVSGVGPLALTPNKTLGPCQHDGRDSPTAHKPEINVQQNAVPCLSMLVIYSVLNADSCR